MEKHKHLFRGFEPRAPGRARLRAERARAERAAQEERSARAWREETERAKAWGEGVARGRAFRAAEVRADFVDMLASAGAGDAARCRVETTFTSLPSFGFGAMLAPGQSARCLVGGTSGVGVHTDEAWLVLSWGEETHDPIVVMVGRPADLHAAIRQASKRGVAARAMLGI